MEDLRRNQTWAHSGCYLKYVIIHRKNLGRSFAEDSILQQKLSPFPLLFNQLAFRGHTENMLSHLAVGTMAKQSGGKKCIFKIILVKIVFIHHCCLVPAISPYSINYASNLSSLMRPGCNQGLWIYMKIQLLDYWVLLLHGCHWIILWNVGKAQKEDAEMKACSWSAP